MDFTKILKRHLLLGAIILACFGITNLASNSHADIMPPSGGGYTPPNHNQYMPHGAPIPPPISQHQYLPDICCDPYRQNQYKRNHCGSGYSHCGTSGFHGGGMYSQMQHFFKMMMQFMNPWASGHTSGSHPSGNYLIGAPPSHLFNR